MIPVSGKRLADSDRDVPADFGAMRESRCKYLLHVNVHTTPRLSISL